MIKKYLILLTLNLFITTAVIADIDPNVILINMSKAYQNVDKYNDKGDVSVLVNKHDEVIYKSKTYFETSYQRPSLFQLKWTDKDNIDNSSEFEIGKDKGNYYLISPKRGKKTFSTMNKLLSSAAGISNGISYLVPAYMVEEMKGVISFNHENVLSEYLGDEMVGGDDTFIVQIKYDDNLEKMWISKESYFIKKYERQNKIDNNKTRIKLINYRHYRDQGVRTLEK